MTVLPNHYVYSTNTPIEPNSDHFSSAVRKPQVNPQTSGATYIEPRANIRSGGLWLELLGALHASRRQAAARELNRCQHLVRDAQVVERRSTNVPRPSTLFVQASRNPRVGPPLFLLVCFVMIHAIAIVRVDTDSRLHSPRLSPPIELSE